MSQLCWHGGGGNTEDSLDEVFDVADTREAIDTLHAAAGESDETAPNGGVHPATKEETAKILAAAQTLVNMHLKYSDIVCTTFVMKAIDNAFPGAVHDGFTKDFVLQFNPVSEPFVGAVMQFKTPTHVVLVTGVANGQVTQFLGSQGKTGPAYVNLPQFYWSKYYNLPDNVRYYQIMLPDAK